MPAKKKAAAKPAKHPGLDPEIPSKPFAIARLKLQGAASPASTAPIEKAFATAVPPSYAALLARAGAGTFAGRLRFAPPAEVVSATKRWRKKWTADVGRKLFLDYADLLGEHDDDLVQIAHSIDGDDVVFVAGAPDAIYVLPRNRNGVERFTGLDGVLGRYVAVAARVGEASTAYATERAKK
jgi:hypothetical protein